MKPVKKFVRKVVPTAPLKWLELAYRKSRGLFWQAFYGFPARGARIIAVTGTNGKSTTCAYINEMLKTAGYKTAVMTTPFTEINGKRLPSGTTYTLEKQSQLQRFLARAKRADVDWAVVEVTSHALAQERIMGVNLTVAVLTNLTQEHLDYHKTMQDYGEAKARLLHDYKVKFVVLNADDEWFEFFNKRSGKASVVAYGKNPKSTVRVKSIKLNSAGSQAVLETKDTKLHLKTPLLGEFNIYNAAAAACAGLVLGLVNKNIARGISKLDAMPGRMEPIDAGQKFGVYIDYGITPDAIKRTLMLLRQITRGKVRIVFGSTGDRDRGKRPLMGEVAAKHADFIYLTDDETYTEDPQTIRKAVQAGIKKAHGIRKTKEIADRKEAIKTAFAEAKAGDAVLITGIGHETSRNMGGKQIPWDERAIARKLLKDLPKA
jgi:UDP-N-acetylmuramoyl-L-alanyl-D-glutamate--2,6-diaminopimelate ligase